MFGYTEVGLQTFFQESRESINEKRHQLWYCVSTSSCLAP